MIAANAFMWTALVVGVLAILSLVLLGISRLLDRRHHTHKAVPPLSIVITCDTRQVLRDFQRAERLTARLARRRWVQQSRPQLPDPKPQTLHLSR